MIKFYKMIVVGAFVGGIISSTHALECTQKTHEQSAFSKTASGQEIYEQCSCPGEYAPAYIATREVKLTAHARPNVESATTACTLAKCAMINCGGAETVYRVAEFGRFNVLAPATIELAGEKIDPKTGLPITTKIGVAPGDVVETVGEVGEGECTIRIQGVYGVANCLENEPAKFQLAHTLKDENWMAVRGCREAPTQTVWVGRAAIETLTQGAAGAASFQRWIYPMTQESSWKRSLTKMCPALKLPWSARPRGGGE